MYWTHLKRLTSPSPSTLMALLTGLTLTLLLVAHPAHAFDENKLQRFDKFSPNHAKTFLQLSAEQRQQLAFKYLQQDNLPPNWHFFLLADLSTQDLEETALTNYKALPLYKTLKDKDDNADNWVREQLDEAGKPAAELCFNRLQQTPTNTLPDETQETVLDILDQVCVDSLAVIAQRDEVIEWVITGIENDLHPHHDRLNSFFSQAGLMSRMFFGRHNGYDIGKLNDSQQQRLVDAYIKRIFIPNEDTEERMSLWHVEQLSGTVHEMDNEVFQQRFVAALGQQTLNDADDVNRVLRALLDTHDQEKAATLFWQRGWQHPKADPELLYDTLQDHYGSDALDEAFPEALHKAAQHRIKTHKDLKFAATYMYLIYHAEGGEDWSNGLATADTVLDMADTLPGKQGNDEHTDRLLKYIYLQAAGMQYQQDAEALDKIIAYLDAATAINAEPLSWYAHLAEEEDEERLDQDSDFAAIKHLYTSGQLASIAQWKKDKTRPEKPFKDLALDTYSLFTDNSIKYRLWHQPETGEALLLDDTGVIQIFDGYGINDKHTLPVQFVALNQETTYSGKFPKLTAELDEWIEYAAKHLFSSDEAQKTPSHTITEFVATVKNTPLSERLLFAEIDSDGYIASYPDYLEYNRYGQHLLINTDIDGSIEQYLLTYDTAEHAKAWTTTLATQTPKQLKAMDLWYRHDEDDDEGLVTRHYEHPDDYDQPSVTLAALKPDFTHSHDCDVPIEPDTLAPSSTNFSQTELALYAKGYYMAALSHDDECQQTQPEENTTAATTSENKDESNE